MALNLTLKDKDERKGKQNKSVVFVRTENNLRTTLKIMKMKVKKIHLRYLKLYYEKEGGRITRQVYLNTM